MATRKQAGRSTKGINAPKMSDSPEELSPEALEYFRKMGSKGGKRTVKLHGKEHFAAIGSRGGQATRAVKNKPKPKPKAKAK